MKGLELIVKINTVLFPTEDASKVEAAIKNIFPQAKLVTSEDRIQGTSTEMDTFIELLTKQQIRDSARDILLKDRNGDTTTVLLNKQVASRSKVGFAEPGESSLGNIEVTFKLKEWEPLIELLTPPQL